MHTTYRFCVSDGLLCICEFLVLAITLWNPATKEFRRLPKLSRRIKWLIQLGFGRYSSSNDYKVICTWSEPKQPALAAVYRLSSNSWRMLKGVDEAVRILRTVQLCDNTSVNGVYYWRVLSKGLINKVLAFHFRDEVFQFIDGPPVQYLKGKLLPLPHESRISLWINRYNDGTHSRVTDNEVWVLNDDGRSWSKLLNFERPLPGVMRMFGFWNGVSKVFIDSTAGTKLMLYDLDTQESIHPGTRGTLWVCIYEESLVPIKLKARPKQKIKY